MRTTIACCAAFLATIPATASANDVIAIGVGPIVSIGASATTGLSPDDALKTATGAGLTPDTLAKAGPSFGGPHVMGGLMADLRLVKVIGIEIDLARTWVGAKSQIPGMNPILPGAPEISFEQWQWQVALLPKFALPIPIIAPFIAIGPEFVFPDGQPLPPATNIKVNPNVPGVNLFAHADPYTLLTGLVGVEIKLPIPKIDIRIPVGARLSYNLSSPDSPAMCGSLNGMQLAPQIPATGNCRMKLEGTLTPTVAQLNVTFRTEWKYMVGGFAGLAFYFP